MLRMFQNLFKLLLIFWAKASFFSPPHDLVCVLRRVQLTEEAEAVIPVQAKTQVKKINKEEAGSLLKFFNLLGERFVSFRSLSPHGFMFFFFAGGYSLLRKLKL
jgi:hypothetical protein